MILAGVRRVARASLDRALAPARARRLRAAARDASDLRLNLGCGGAVIEGWINTDVNRAAPYYLDATRAWPLAPGTVAYIYADNMIEHVALADARSVLRSAHAALRPNGRIRLATPDVEGTARMYLDPAELGDRHLDRHRRHGYRVDHRVDLLNLMYLESGHCGGYLYDFAALEAELARAGFVDVRRCAPGESVDEALRGLEARHEPTDAAASLIVEARKPESSLEVDGRD